jgi:hypothetical protein
VRPRYALPYLVDSAVTAHLVQHTRTKINSRLENSDPQLAKLDPPQSVLQGSGAKYVERLTSHRLFGIDRLLMTPN